MHCKDHNRMLLVNNLKMLYVLQQWSSNRLHVEARASSATRCNMEEKESAVALGRTIT